MPIGYVVRIENRLNEAQIIIDAIEVKFRRWVHFVQVGNVVGHCPAMRHKSIGSIAEVRRLIGDIFLGDEWESVCALGKVVPIVCVRTFEEHDGRNYAAISIVSNVVISPKA